MSKWSPQNFIKKKNQIRSGYNGHMDNQKIHSSISLVLSVLRHFRLGFVVDKL